MDSSVNPPLPESLALQFLQLEIIPNFTQYKYGLLPLRLLNYRNEVCKLFLYVLITFNHFELLASG